MKKIYIAPLLLAMLLLTACAAARETENAIDIPPAHIQSEVAETTTQNIPMNTPMETPTEEVGSADTTPIPEQEMILTIGGARVPVQWEDNDSVWALKELATGDGLRVQMSMYGGFEQVGDIGTSLPRNDTQTTSGAKS